MTPPTTIAGLTTEKPTDTYRRLLLRTLSNLDDQGRRQANALDRICNLLLSLVTIAALLVAVVACLVGIVAAQGLR